MSDQIRDYLVAQMEEKLKSCKSIQDAADEQGRTLTDDERHTIEQKLEAANKNRTEIKARDDDAAFRKSIDEFTGPVVVTTEPSQATSIGDAFIKSEGFAKVKAAEFKGERWSTGAVELPFNANGMKTLVSEAANTNFLGLGDTQPGILEKLAWPTRVADLFAQGTTNGNIVRYLYENTNTNAAAGVTEGQPKPESAITFEDGTATVGKIATILPVTDEMLEDVAQIRSYLDNRLATFVQRQEDSDLLNGAGAPTVTGILQASITSNNVYALDSSSIIEAIFQAMTAIQTASFLEADGIVCHPTDWAAIRLMKDLNGQFYGGGPFTSAYGNPGSGAGPANSLWGLPVVVTTAIAAGTILIGSFKQGAQLFRRSGLTVEASNGYNAFFAENKTMIRAETRLALAVYRPTAFYAITSANLLEGS